MSMKNFCRSISVALEIVLICLTVTPAQPARCAFSGSAAQQAKCLLRPVMQYGNLGPQLQTLPSPLDSLVGSPVSVTREALQSYLVSARISESDIGGALNRPVSSNDRGELASYFIIHDTSTPLSRTELSFPPTIDTAAWSGNNLRTYAQSRKAHVFINRLGQSATSINFSIAKFSTKYERRTAHSTGMFLAIELVQPRRFDRRGIDAIAPSPGFTQAQLDRLALVYVAASVRRGIWLTPSYHAVIDVGIPNAHDDPQNFDFNGWAERLGNLLSILNASPAPAEAARADMNRAAPGRPASATAIRFAVIGDYGEANRNENSGPAFEVARLVKGWNPEFIITTGDNNYRCGDPNTIDDRIGQYYHDFIHPYQGRYGAGASENKFFPSPGNHDWSEIGCSRPHTLTPYTDYFELPNNERYYTFTRGPVQFFALDSDQHEPDRNTADGLQATWLRRELGQSTARWKVVYFHHSPYTSGLHQGETTGTRMRWPFREWGASIVLTGHDHNYERLTVAGFPYIVNGLGGKDRRSFARIIPESRINYNCNFGAMLVTASEENIVFEFHDRADSVVDSYSLPSGSEITMNPCQRQFQLRPSVRRRGNRAALRRRRQNR